MSLFGRVVVVTAGTLRITGLRVAFKVEKSLKPAPNKLELLIANLSADTRARLQGVVVPVVLEAGYEGATEVLFVGDATRVYSERQGPDWVTHLEAGDKQDALRGNRITTTLAPGTDLKVAALAAARKMGADITAAAKRFAAGDFPSGVQQLASGLSFSGPAPEHFDHLMRVGGLEWSIQDGVLQVLPTGGPTTDEVVALSPGSGLVGSPEIGQAGLVKVKALIQGRLSPGRKVRLDARSVQGFYRVEKTTFSGDSRGQDWYAEMECKPT